MIFYWQYISFKLASFAWVSEVYIMQVSGLSGEMWSDLQNAGHVGSMIDMDLDHRSILMLYILYYIVLQ